MYDTVKDIIDHTWNATSNTSTEQSIVYYICGMLIVVFSVVIIDLTYRVFSNFWKSKKSN